MKFQKVTAIPPRLPCRPLWKCPRHGYFFDKTKRNKTKLNCNDYPPPPPFISPLCLFRLAGVSTLMAVLICVQLIELHGEDARLFLLQCLVEETGFKEQKAHAHHGNKDAQKVRLRGLLNFFTEFFPPSFLALVVCLLSHAHAFKCIGLSFPKCFTISFYSTHHACRFLNQDDVDLGGHKSIVPTYLNFFRHTFIYIFFFSTSAKLQGINPTCYLLGSYPVCTSAPAVVSLDFIKTSSTLVLVAVSSGTL